MASDAYDVGKFGALLDAQFEYTGRRLATASADSTVRIWCTERHEVLSELRGGRAPVITLSWGRGRSGALLATGSSDGQVTIWREARPDFWQRAHDKHITGATSAVAFSDAEHGCLLAVAGADELGIVTMLYATRAAGPAGEQWQVTSFPAHEGGVIGLSWSPSTSAATLATGPSVGRAQNHAPRRFVTGGVDGSLYIWCAAGEKGDCWMKECELADERAGTGALRDVAWRPNLGIPTSMIASCTEEGIVCIWSQEVLGQPWYMRAQWTVAGDARRLSWSHAGMFLGVSVGDSDSLLFKESQKGPWERVHSFEE